METVKKANWHGSKQVGVMFFTAVLFLIGTSIIGGNNNTVFPLFSGIRGWNINIINAVSGVACILKALGILGLAKATRKIGNKLMIAVTLFISAALLVVFGFTESLPVFLITILIIGFLGGGYEKNGGMGLTANWWPTKKGIVLGITTIGIIAMNILYVPFMPKLLTNLGLGWGMSVIATILVIVGLISLAFIKNCPEEAGTYPDGNPEFACACADIEKEMKEYKSPFTFKKLLSDKDTWLISFGAGFAFLSVMSYIASAIPSMLSLGYSYGAATSVFAVGGIFGIIGSFIFGIIDQKIGTRKAFLIYFVFIIIGFIFLLFMSKGMIFCWISGVMIFAAQGALCNLLPSYVVTKYGRWDYNAGYRVIGTIFEIGAGVGIMMLGFFTNYTVLYVFDIVLLAIGFVMMIASNDKFLGKEH